MAPSSSKQQLKSAKSLIDSGDFSSALSVLDALLAADASNYHGHVLRGVALRSSSDLSGAIAAYSKAVELRPEAPLAHKGIIDAVPETDEDPNRRALLAKAYAALGGEGLVKAAEIMYAIARQDNSRVDEAVDLLQRAKEANALHSENIGIGSHPSWRIAHLLAGRIPAEGTPREEALLQTEGPFCAALDDVEDLLRHSAVVVTSDLVRSVCEERIVRRCVRGENVKQGLALLRQCGAHEALLQLSETAVGSQITSNEVFIAALRDLHRNPLARSGRARFIVAAELFQLTEDIQPVVENLAGLGAVNTGTKVAEPKNCTTALVVALLRLHRGEHKLALETTRLGQQIAEVEGGKERYKMVLALLEAAALVGERKYKAAMKSCEKIRMFAQRETDPWLERAANRELVDTAVFAHGRKSKQASTAIEEAAGSAENDYGVLECAWTDALAGDIDTERMSELTERAIEKSKRSTASDEELRWESRILSPRFILSKAELAATASTRLGQMLIKENGVGPDSLAKAQKCHMQAANLHKGSPNPFAHLGWIFEEMAKIKDGKKMSARAIRCYEKALAIDAAHPLAGRRLSSILIEKGCVDEGALVARDAADRNPKARWAHNIVGWFRMKKTSYLEAAVSFRNALRGKLNPSSKAEEVLFGTEVGRTADDNDLIVDVDSWRGLSAAYRMQGKTGPAVACADDALALIRKPPPVYKQAGVPDIPALQQSLAFLLESEKAMLLQIQRKTEEASSNMNSVLRDARAPLTVSLYLSEAEVFQAAKEWLSGCYSEATRLRRSAARILDAARVEHQEKQPQLNPSSVLKQLGDTLMETATSHPKMMGQLVGEQKIQAALLGAQIMYCKALHYSPWKKGGSEQDIVTALLATAVCKDDEVLASHAIDLLSQNETDPCVLAISFLDMAALTSMKDLGRAAVEQGLQVSKSAVSRGNIVALNVSLALLAAKLGEISTGAKSSVSAVRHDPTDWRAWYAVATVREADARRNNWPAVMIRSSEDAYREADRLGGGPCAVHGVVQCLTELLRRRKEVDLSIEEAYREACYCVSAASRAGLSEPPVCREVIDDFRERQETQALLRAEELGRAQTWTEVRKHVHLYPFIKRVTALAVS